MLSESWHNGTINSSICTIIDIVRTLPDTAAYTQLPPSISNQQLVPRGLTHLFLFVNVLAMCTCSTLIIIRKYPEYAVFGLIGVVITQALGYGLIFDLNFFLRNLSVMGGLLMVLSDSWVRKRFAPAGLPLPAEKDRKKYIQLAGRILLILLFVGFIWSGIGGSPGYWSVCSDWWLVWWLWWVSRQSGVRYY